MGCEFESLSGRCVVDYGTFPDQKQNYFSLRDPRRTLATVFPQSGLEGAI